MASFAVVQVVWDCMVVVIPLNNIKHLHLIRTYSSSADFQLRACYGNLWHGTLPSTALQGPLRLNIASWTTGPSILNFGEVK